MWAWIYCKEKNRTEEIARMHPDSGDVWLWVAVDADTKLVPSWARQVLENLILIVRTNFPYFDQQPHHGFLGNSGHPNGGANGAAFDQAANHLCSGFVV